MPAVRDAVGSFKKGNFRAPRSCLAWVPTQRADNARKRRGATSRASQTLAEEALAIIRSEYATDLRLPEVAQRIGASVRALQRALAEHSELSFSEQLRTTRLNVAARLLRGTDLPVGEVAIRAGYTSHAPFTKAFRQYHGISPKAYAAAGADEHRTHVEP